jgi:transposase
VAVVHSILTLYERGWSKRRIARELGINRETVQRQLALTHVVGSKPAISTPGKIGPFEAPVVISTAGVAGAETSKPAISTAGTKGPESRVVAGRQSQCEAVAEAIEQKLQAGLTAQRIYQDLVSERGFEGSYQSVKRFVRQLRAAQPQRFYRLESLPGEEAQVDFGSGPRLSDGTGHFHKSSIFRIVLSYSRKAYSEAVRHQDSETFIRCLENAFRYFGGVTQTLVIDNLRAAVTKADWYEPELQPKVAEFARYYGTLILPTRPYQPRHKGKVESAVKYVKGNALPARSFVGLADLNRFLLDWEIQVADRRIHGTTRQQVAARFEAAERAALLPLPPMPFPCFAEARRQVHRDSYVEIARAYYEVPAEYIGREVWVRWDARTVRVFNHRFEQIAMHARLEPGRFSTPSGGGRVERASGYYQQQAARLGPACGAWAQQLFAERGVLGIRVVQGLISLAKRYRARALNDACQQALSYGTRRLADVRRLLQSSERQQDLPLLESHPLIRDLGEYGRFLAENSQPQPKEIEA